MSIEGRKKSVIGAMPLFRGAHRTRVLLDVDERILAFIVVFLIMGVFYWPIFIIGISLYFLGRILNATAPYLIDDIASYFRWQSWNMEGSLPDDTFPNEKVKEPKHFHYYRGSI